MYSNVEAHLHFTHILEGNRVATRKKATRYDSSLENLNQGPLKPISLAKIQEVVHAGLVLLKKLDLSN